MPKYSQLLAYAQLMRLPNVFTAFADVGMAGAATGAISGDAGPWLLVMLASGCLYLSGMVWNDVFDRHEDARTQPFRPIPSGRVGTGTAVILGVMLMAAGLGLAYLAFEPFRPFNTTPSGLANPFALALLLAVFVLLYDAWLKHTPFGPIGMGACRLLNVLMGASVGGFPPTAEYLPVHLAGVIGVYIVGVTWFARTEETDSDRRDLALAAGVMALSLVLALLLPLHRPAGETPWYFPFLVVGFGFYVGVPVATAISRRDPKSVQLAVKACILGLVALDAVLATAFVGLWGLLILLLLPPARFLGKWVYST